MESSSSRQHEEEKRQADIRKQIETLQALLPPDSCVTLPPPPPGTPKRKQREPTLLAPATPSPKKRKVDPNPRPNQVNRPSTSSRVALQSLNDVRTVSRQPSAVIIAKPAPSTFVAKLAASRKRIESSESADTHVRSSAFSDRPHPPPDPATIDSSSKRDDRLALVEDLELGPADHKPPFDDPTFEQLEPNSGIRLSSRIVPHEDFQDYLRGRYYLSPSRLYSAIRLLPDKQGYDVPVFGDWVTIAVVAERGPVKFSRAPVGVGREEDDNGVEPKSSASSKVKKEDAHTKNGKKYVNLKLVDFGARSRGASSATGGKAVIRGDAFLTLLLFESDGFDLLTEEEGSKPKKVYKGGSRGAFEAMSKLKEGDVIALLNPKILKPFQRASDTPHPTNNILALTPESASSIAVIGKARDLGMCAVVKRDGKVCGSWCDKRVSDVCEWHVQHAVERRRAGRAEFSIGTSGMSSTSVPKRKKPAYDPAKQWGLKPADAVTSGGSGATYVISGHVVGGSGTDLYVGENMGREGQAKAKRQNEKDSDRALKALLQRDKEGMKAVMKARQVAKEMDDRDEADKKKSTKAKGKEKDREQETLKRKRKKDEVDLNEENEEETNQAEVKSGKNAYSAQVIKQLGFDPTLKGGQRRVTDSAMQEKLEALAALQSSRKEIALGPRPGQRIRSGVVAPTKTVSGESSHSIAVQPAILPDLDDSDDDPEPASFGSNKPPIPQSDSAGTIEMVDLDDL